MEGCEEHTETVGQITITSFTVKGVVVARRRIKIYGGYKDETWHNAASWLHRDNDEPAVIGYGYKDEKVVCQEWYKDGKWHRDGDEPAIIDYEDDKVTYRGWYKNGKRHREKGPAQIFITDGAIVNEWWIDGNRIPYADVPEAIRLPPAVRTALRRLPLPIGDAIAWHCEWIWPFEE